MKSSSLSSRRIQARTVARALARQPDAPPIRHVVFEPEGLLLDPTPGVRASLAATAREFGMGQGQRPLPADWTPRCSLYATLAALLGTEDCALIEAAYASYHRHYATLGRRGFVAHADAAELLQLMQAASGCQWHYLSTLGREASCRLLRQHRLDPIIHSVFSSEQERCPGERPQLLGALLATTAAAPATVAVLSDLPADLHAAQRLGMAAVALDYGRCPPDVLRQVPAIHRGGSATAVAQWLRPRIALRPTAAPCGARLH